MLCDNKVQEYLKLLYWTMRIYFVIGQKHCTFPSIWNQMVQLGFIRCAKQSGHFRISYNKWFSQNYFVFL